MPIVDTHQHLWDLSRFQLPWLKGDSKLDRSFLMKDYRQATEGRTLSNPCTWRWDVELRPQQAPRRTTYSI